MLKSSRVKEKKEQRPCKDCMYFRFLSARFGVCEQHEQPSSPYHCFIYKRRLQKIV